jgi:uncharacterized membrane protein
MDTYFHLPIVRHATLITKIIVYVAALVSVGALFIMGFRVAVFSAQNFALTGRDNYVFGSSTVMPLLLIAFITSAVALLYTIARDSRENFIFQRGENGHDKTGVIKWVSHPLNQLVLTFAALAVPVLYAGLSNDMRFIAIVFFGGIIAGFATPPAIAMIRTMLHRNETL